MKVVIKGTEKEIAAFVAELQKQQERVETHIVTTDLETCLTGGANHATSTFGTHNNSVLSAKCKA